MSDLGLKINQTPSNYGLEPSKSLRSMPNSIDLEIARKLAFHITSSFEGGRTNSLQTADSGIISYGKHQATLASGSLERVLKDYMHRTGNPIKASLNKYKELIENRDISLRNNKQFLSLLRDAANDPKMKESQDSVFTKDYWEPVVAISKKLKIKSSIGLAVLYDTKVQGGLQKIINQVAKRLAGKEVTEKIYLEAFLDTRKSYLLDLARKKTTLGDHKSAQLIRNSAQNRIAKLATYLKLSNIN